MQNVFHLLSYTGYWLITLFFPFFYYTFNGYVKIIIIYLLSYLF